MRNALCVILLLALAVPAMAQAVPVIAQDEPLNYFIGYGYINMAVPIHNIGDNAISFKFVLTGEKRNIVVPCIARGQVAKFVKTLRLKHNEVLYFIVGGRLMRRHSGLCIVVTSITLAKFSAGECNN